MWRISVTRVKCEMYSMSFFYNGRFGWHKCTCLCICSISLIYTELSQTFLQLHCRKTFSWDSRSSSTLSIMQPQKLFRWISVLSITIVPFFFEAANWRKVHLKVKKLACVWSKYKFKFLLYIQNNVLNKLLHPVQQLFSILTWEMLVISLGFHTKILSFLMNV